MRPKSSQRLALEGDEWSRTGAANSPHISITTQEGSMSLGRSCYGHRVRRLFGRTGPRWQERQVAVWRGRGSSGLPRPLYALGEYYNQAHIIVENNGYGILTCTRFIKDMAYSNAYLETTADKITERESVKLGFSTNARTKPLIIDQLRAAMREGERNSRQSHVARNADLHRN